MRQSSRVRARRFAVLSTLVALAAAAPGVTARQAAATPTPDFTGVWTNYNAGGAGRLGIGGGRGDGGGGGGRAAGAGRPGGAAAGGGQRAGGAAASGPAQFMTE